MPFLEKLRIRYPIFLSPMAGVTTPKLAATVSNAGGLGALGLGASTIDQAKKQILETQKLTTKPFQLNFFCHQPARLDGNIAQQWINYLRAHFLQFNAQAPEQLNCIYPSFLENDDFLALILETRPSVVSFHFGLPHAHQIQALKNAGIVTMVTATNLVEALQIQEAGIDIIVAQGIEAGGHRGLFHPHHESGLSTSDLVSLLLQHCKIPVVAAGGIMTGKQAQLYLNIGASAVQLGTAFIACPESNATQAYRDALMAKPIVTQLSASISGRPARGILNAWHTQIDTPSRPDLPVYPYTYDIAKQLHAVASAQQSQDYAAFWAGSGAMHIQNLAAAELFQSIVADLA
ncbi:nitronate monooxygenase [Acinetobacter sp. MD2(2019)]|uniref:NAD(P)H-dependent flavin oxidoreductase n=1 Tax=Acinetobacter sp. MD2(2019) TaxID=2605273 RepID=UPI002D1F1E67|nr:nitronate monooxygenase [Acinetobacter sp. MD2(2019)]MEB3753799.1 nitronate monooxygenase [Acinetobacter sp. MD2(2019)]